MPKRLNLPSKNILRPIIDRLPIAIYVKDVDCKFTYINLQGARNLGVEQPDEALGKTDADFFNAKQAKAWISEEKRIMASKEDMIDRKELELWDDGRRRWALTSKFPLFAPDGTLLGLFGMTRDITESERINLAVAGSRGGLWYRALNSDDVWYSPHWKEILGYPDDELPNLREEFKKRVLQEDWPLVTKECDAHLNGKAKYYECCFRMLHKDGAYRLIRSRGMVTRDENDKPQVFAGSHVDITDSVDRESFYLKVLDTIPNLIFVKGKDLRFVFVNEAIAKNFKKRKDEIIGKKDEDINPDKEQVARFVKDDTYVITNQKAIDIPEEVLNDAQGNERTLTTKKLPLIFPGTTENHVLGVATDITDLKAVREDLRKTLSVLAEAVKDIEDSDSEEIACEFALVYLEHLGYTSAMLSFINDSNGSLVIAADSKYAIGKFKQVADQIHQKYDLTKSKHDLLPLVLAEKKSRFITDSISDVEYDVTLFKEYGIVNQYCVPIATDSLMIGTLQIDLDSKKEIPETARKMFDALGAHLSIAIERHRVLHKLETANNDIINQARMITFEVAAAKIMHELNRSMGDYGKRLREKISDVEIRSNKAAVSFLKFTQKQIARWALSVQENIDIVKKNEKEGDYKVEDIVREVISNFQHKAAAQNRKLNGIYEAPDATVSIRRGSLLELLSCLIVNSFEAEARQIDVVVRKRKIRHIDGTEPHVQIVVSDDGHGIPEEYTSKIFSFGWSSKGKHAYGMGLTIIGLLAKSMEGDVRLESRGLSSGQGKTSFVVEIPLVYDSNEGIA